MRRALPRLLAAGIAVGLLGCRMSQAPQWDALVNEFLESHFTANPAAAASAGRHEFDGRIADLSTAGLRAEAARLHQMREQALRFDSARLDSARRFERDYLLSVIDGQLFWLERAEWPWRNPPTRWIRTCT